MGLRCVVVKEMKRKQDAAVKAAKRIFSNLKDRRGIGHELVQCDDDIQEEILKMMIDIIREEIVDSTQEEISQIITDIGNASHV